MSSDAETQRWKVKEKGMRELRKVGGGSWRGAAVEGERRQRVEHEKLSNDFPVQTLDHALRGRSFAEHRQRNLDQ